MHYIANEIGYCLVIHAVHPARVRRDSAGHSSDLWLIRRTLAGDVALSFAAAGDASRAATLQPLLEVRGYAARQNVITRPPATTKAPPTKTGNPGSVRNTKKVMICQTTKSVAM